VQRWLSVSAVISGFCSAITDESQETKMDAIAIAKDATPSYPRIDLVPNTA
jgi:hypothetical protein